MISCQVEPFVHFSFPTNTECVSTPSQMKRLSEHVITSVDDITFPTGEPLSAKAFPGTSFSQVWPF